MDWTCNTIWREQLLPGAFATIKYKGNKAITPIAEGATYFDVDRFKTKQSGFRELTGVSAAEYLELNFSNITSFAEAAKFGRLKRLETSWCLKLESDFGLAEVSDHLEWLHIKTSKRFRPERDLFDLRNLKVLCLNGCGPLQDLHFLERMPLLLDFRFVNTNVVDGDLSPLLSHPSLVSVGFLDKRHYSHRAADINRHFKEREENEKVYVYKGDFRTFRHRAFDA